MTRYLVNAFSLGMLPKGQVCDVRVVPIGRRDAAALLAGGFASFVGHESTARLLEAELGLQVPVNRDNLSLWPGEQLIVAQYVGPRLPEGATELPEGAEIHYFIVHLRGAVYRHEETPCRYCGRTVPPEAYALGWPALCDDGSFICPSCCGPRAHDESGRLLRPEEVRQEPWFWLVSADELCSVESS